MQPFLMTNDTEEKWKRRKASFNVPVNAITVVKLPRKRQSRDEGNTGTGKRFFRTANRFLSPNFSSFILHSSTLWKKRLWKVSNKFAGNGVFFFLFTLKIVTEIKNTEIKDLEEICQEKKRYSSSFKKNLPRAPLPLVVFLDKYKYDFISFPLIPFFSFCLNISLILDQRNVRYVISIQNNIPLKNSIKRKEDDE